jgi:hypothetical protein
LCLCPLLDLLNIASSLPNGSSHRRSCLIGGNGGFSTFGSELLIIPIPTASDLKIIGLINL